LQATGKMNLRKHLTTDSDRVPNGTLKAEQPSPLTRKQSSRYNALKRFSRRRSSARAHANGAGSAPPSRGGEAVSLKISRRSKRILRLGTETHGAVRLVRAVLRDLATVVEQTVKRSLEVIGNRPKRAKTEKRDQVKKPVLSSRAPKSESKPPRQLPCYPQDTRPILPRALKTREKGDPTPPPKRRMWCTAKMDSMVHFEQVGESLADEFCFVCGTMWENFYTDIKTRRLARHCIANSEGRMELNEDYFFGRPDFSPRELAAYPGLRLEEQYALYWANTALHRKYGVGGLMAQWYHERGTTPAEEFFRELEELGTCTGPIPLRLLVRTLSRQTRVKQRYSGPSGPKLQYADRFRITPETLVVYGALVPPADNPALMQVNFPRREGRPPPRKARWRKKRRATLVVPHPQLELTLS
jgi:hypothetical protein